MFYAQHAGLAAELQQLGSVGWPRRWLDGGAGAAVLRLLGAVGWLQALLAGSAEGSELRDGAGGCKVSGTDLQPQGGTGSHPSWAKGTGARPRLAPAQQHAAVCLLPVPSPAQALHSQLAVP